MSCCQAYSFAPFQDAFAVAFHPVTFAGQTRKWNRHKQKEKQRFRDASERCSVNIQQPLAWGLLSLVEGFPWHYLASFARIHKHTHTLINAWNLFTVVLLVVVALFSFNTPPCTVLCSLGTSCESWSLKAFRRFVLTQLSSAIQTGRLCRLSFSLSFPSYNFASRIPVSFSSFGSVFFFNP